MICGVSGMVCRGSLRGPGFFGILSSFGGFLWFFGSILR